MPVPPQVLQEIVRRYPKPRIDPEWLQGCYEWVTEQYNLNVANHLPQIIEHVENQLLESDLADSMLRNTGLPLDAGELFTLTGSPILVEITSITDIGVSAYNLNKVRSVRDERLAAGEQEEAEGDVEVEGEGPVPVYPRSMLRMEISDGTVTLRAIEFRSIPELRLGSTPLGYKILLKPGTLIRRGIVFLDHKIITLKGHLNADREANQKINFAKSLCERLGLPEPEEQERPPAPPPAVLHAALQPPLNGRSPLRDISPPPSPPVDTRNQYSDDEDQPRRRKIPNHAQQKPTPGPSSSTFFGRSSSATLVSDHTSLRSSLMLSPVRSAPVIIDSDDENDEDMDQPISSRKSRKNESSEFGEDDNWDPALLDQAFKEAEMKVDMGVLASSVGSMTMPSVTPAATAPKETITVLDSDEEDKENIPASKRHVKRRLVRPPIQAIEVIDISD